MPDAKEKPGNTVASGRGGGEAEGAMTLKEKLRGEKKSLGPSSRGAQSPK